MFNEVLINKENLLNNIEELRKKNENSKLCAMVKANAYGIGVVEVVKIIDEKVDFYGVVNFEEAKKIKNLTTKKILIVGAIDYEEEVDSSFSYACHSLQDIKFLISKNKELNIHLKVNSGMNRFGFKSFNEFKKAICLIRKSNLVLEGVFTHFATNDKYTELQFQNFQKFMDYTKKQFSNCLIHTDNSIVNKFQNHNLGMVRIGFDLYNLNNDKNKVTVKIKTKVVAIQKVKAGELVGYDYRFVANKNIKIAVLPIGYADGFGLENIGLKLKLKNEECEVLNVCMDCFMLDVTKIKIKKGDTLFILDESNSLKMYSNYQNVSVYQIMTNFSKIRARRLIVSSNHKHI